MSCGIVGFTNNNERDIFVQAVTNEPKLTHIKCVYLETELVVILENSTKSDEERLFELAGPTAKFFEDFEVRLF